MSEGRCRALSLRAADLRLIDQSAVANAVSLLNAKHRGGDGGSISQLDAIAGWVDTIVKDSATDIGAVAKRENLAERHVRFLTPLAYLSPRIIEATAEGRAPADFTVTRLARNLPAIWGGPGRAAWVRLIHKTTTRASSPQSVRQTSLGVLDGF